MTEEEKIEQTEEVKTEKKCSKWAIGKEYRCFLLTIFASFFGCLVALCLYNASVKPPCPPPAMMMPPQFHQFDGQRFEHHRGMPSKFRGEKKFEKGTRPEFKGEKPEFKGERPPKKFDKD